MAQPELWTGRWVKDPGAAGTLSSGPRICLIDRPPSQTAPRCHRPTQPGTQRRHRRSGPRRGDASHGSRCTQRLCWFRSRPAAKRHSGPRPCHRGRPSRGYLLRRVRAASAGVLSSHAKRVIRRAWGSRSAEPRLAQNGLFWGVVELPAGGGRRVRGGAGCAAALSLLPPAGRGAAAVRAAPCRAG